MIATLPPTCLASADESDLMSRPAVAEAALQLHDMGLPVLPAIAKDGKSVAGTMSGFQKWRRRLPRGKVEQLFTKHPDGCIALLVGHCRLVVVDCDDDNALAIAEVRFGHTPILVRTPSGRGGHLYYRAPSEAVRQANLRQSEGLAIDIKGGKAAYVIVPPSVRPSSGIAYRFERGCWADLQNLPTFNAMAKGTAPRRMVEEGSRNDQLFRRALGFARDCETKAELALKVHVANEAECDPPIPWDEVERIAVSAWRYQEMGQNRVGRGRYVMTPEARFEQLMDVPNAFVLDTRMRLIHEGQRARFAASPKAMAAADVLPGWTVARYRNAIQALVDRGVWALLKKGGRGAGDPSQYGFTDCSLQAAKGTKFAPNTNRTPLALGPNSGQTVAATRRRAAA